MIKNKEFRFILKGKTAVFVDWANVHGWEEKMKWEIDLDKLGLHLRSYKNINEMRFYFGTDIHPSSKEQIKKAEKAGFFIVTKPVKYLPVKDRDIIVWKRKCDFDLEIGLDCYENIDSYDGFIFFSGDGDFATLYKRLLKRGKQVIVVSASGSLGREIAFINQGIYIVKVKRLYDDIRLKKYPSVKD